MGRKMETCSEAEVVGEISLETLKHLCQEAAAPPSVLIGGSVLPWSYSDIPPISVFPQVSSRSPAMTLWIRCSIPE